MIKQRLYYAIKPYIPRRIRMGLRQIIARRALNKHADIWPINEAAAAKPSHWTGWPNGKDFALVLSHDVEGVEGLAKCRQLAELEMEFGLRSSFNFVPEGDYSVSIETREWLLHNGFEVGVHDLQHDGKLYQSLPDFQKKAGRINQYIESWRASGFRSGFMLRNLDWIHHLDLLYDSSTFDTDPFEFQPVGAGTIFPFWISRPASLQPVTGWIARPGYVELPYTLPQDSTVFLVLGESAPDIWKKKTDWLASKGGMALVNVHPDYMAFTGPGNHREYPVQLYREFLQYVTSTYAGKFWHALPRDVAGWYRSTEPVQAAISAGLQPPDGEKSPNLRQRVVEKRVAVLLYSVYPADPRPRRAAEAMVEAGWTVDLFCLAETDQDLSREKVNGVNVFRLRLKRQRTRKWFYLWQYGRFLVSAFFFITRRDLYKKYDLVHVHNMPDFLIFAAIFPKMRGAGILLDLHDPMPELMMSIYGLPPENRGVRALQVLERWSIRMASQVLTPNVTFRNLFVQRGCPPGKISIVMNSPREDIFAPECRQRIRSLEPKPARFSIMHHGLIAHRHGVDLLVEAIAALRIRIPGIRMELFGAATPFLDTVLHRAAELNISELVNYHGAKSQAEIARAIDESDLGVIPNRRSSFTEINFPTRIFEYLSMHCPVIAPATTGILDYFAPDQLITFEPNNVSDLANKIFGVWENPASAAGFVGRGHTVYTSHRWEGEKRRLLETAYLALDSHS